MLLGVIAVIIFLSILILVHELGHFLAAKKFGLLVEEFGFGLPPRIWGKKIGETIYSINALPFGGFVKIYGEDAEVTPEKPFSKTAVVPSQRGETPLDSQPHSAAFGGNLARSASETFSQKVSPVFSRSFKDQTIWRRVLIVSAGVLMNFLLGWLVISVVFSVGLPQAVLITDVRANSPAAEVGLQTGDKVAGFSNIDEFIKYIDQNRGKEIDLKIERSGKEIGFRTTPRLNPPVGEGALGIGLVEAGLPKQNIAKSFIEGFKASVGIIKTIFVALINLISKALVGEATLEAVAGPVGIVKITAQAGSLGFVYLLQLLALISLNLAVINIFPFPALDGGRLLFLLIEKIKGSPLPAKSERYANAVGMALLLFLMALITIKDIGRFL
jgi:regulator of sigma E protease